MSWHYPASQAFRSHFEPERLFATSAEARAFDRGFAAETIEKATSTSVAAALAADEGDLVRKAIGFLFAELPAVCTDRAA